MSNTAARLLALFLLLNAGMHGFNYFEALLSQRACMEAHDTYTCHQQWVPGPEKGEGE